jgi:hypothetical protein
MIVSQFKRVISEPGLGFASRDGSDTSYGKVGECSGLTPSAKPPVSSQPIKFSPPKFFVQL